MEEKAEAHELCTEFFLTIVYNPFPTTSSMSLLKFDLAVVNFIPFPHL